MASNTMKIEPVSKLYAKAVFELASESNILDKVLSDFSELLVFLKEQPLLEKALSAFMFSVEDREALGVEVFSKAGVHPFLIRLVRLMISKNRLTLIESVYKSLRDQADASKGVVRGTVNVVEPLSDSEIEDLSRALSKKLNKQVILEPVIDKEILGGLVVQIEGKTFDGSLKTAIRRLKENLERQSI
jgi:F-type H+-transporting ATPase subunit delta